MNMKFLRQGLNTLGGFISGLLHRIMPRKITPGMYVYRGNIVRSGIIKGKEDEIIAVVGYAKRNIWGRTYVLAYCVGFKTFLWSPKDMRFCSTLKMKNGKEATKAIVSAFHEYCEKYGKRRIWIAAKYCQSYSAPGIEAGQTWLPTASELEKSHLSVVMSAFHYLGFCAPAYLWSSTASSTWKVYIGDCLRDDVGYIGSDEFITAVPYGNKHYPAAVPVTSFYV